MALGPRGNNFVTGGKLAHMNAEEAYTVSLEVHQFHSFFKKNVIDINICFSHYFP